MPRAAIEIILEGGGVRILLVGNTKISHGVTSSTFAAVPDAPVSSFTLTLPMSPHSALAANGSLCAQPLLMPTTIVGQNGAQVKQDTAIVVAGCAGGGRGGTRCIRILRRKFVRRTLILTVRTCAAGRITARGKNLASTSRRLRRASTTSTTLVRAAIQRTLATSGSQEAGARAASTRRQKSRHSSLNGSVPSRK